MTYDELATENRVALRKRVWLHLRAHGDLPANTIASNLRLTIENVAGALSAMAESGGVTFDETTKRWRACAIERKP